MRLKTFLLALVAALLAGLYLGHLATDGVKPERIELQSYSHGHFSSFGKHWKPVTQELADALAEGETAGPEHADTRVWENCMVRIPTGHNRKAPLVCPDGFVIR